jgi:hypothetical protein
MAKVLKLTVKLSRATVRGFEAEGFDTNEAIRDAIVERLEEYFGEMANAGDEAEDDEDGDGD